MSCLRMLSASGGKLCLPAVRKGPLCRKHRVPGRKECASCVFDIRKEELQALTGQRMNIKQFPQFTFILFAVFLR
jgi:hypothetical protein